VAPGLNSNSTTETTITATGTAQVLPSLRSYGLNHTYHIKHKVNPKQDAYQVLCEYRKTLDLWGFQALDG